MATLPELARGHAALDEARVAHRQKLADVDCGSFPGHAEQHGRGALLLAEVLVGRLSILNHGDMFFKLKIKKI